MGACQRIQTIAYHIHDALKAGATRQEVIESIGVVVLASDGALFQCMDRLRGNSRALKD